MIEQYLTEEQLKALRHTNMFDKVDALIRFIATKSHVLRVFTWVDQHGKLFLVEVDIVCECKCVNDNSVISSIMKEIRKQKQFKDLTNLIYINCIENCEKQIMYYGNTNAVVLDVCD